MSEEETQLMRNGAQSMRRPGTKVDIVTQEISELRPDVVKQFRDLLADPDGTLVFRQALAKSGPEKTV